jgi:hypothetical protein
VNVRAERCAVNSQNVVQMGILRAEKFLLNRKPELVESRS